MPRETMSGHDDVSMASVATVGLAIDADGKAPKLHERSSSICLWCSPGLCCNCRRSFNVLMGALAWIWSRCTWASAPTESDCSSLASLCSMFSFHLFWVRKGAESSHLAACHYVASDSKSVCRLLFTMHGVLCALHREQGGFDCVIWHLIFTPLQHHAASVTVVRLTFSLRQVTQAVILRLISGVLRSPKASRKARAADRSDIVSSMMEEDGL